MEPHLNRPFGQSESRRDLLLCQILGVAQTHEVAIVRLQESKRLVERHSAFDSVQLALSYRD
jgi:hypothetical protein